jgi:hypothetical protein
VEPGLIDKKQTSRKETRSMSHRNFRKPFAVAVGAAVAGVPSDAGMAQEG